MGYLFAYDRSLNKSSRLVDQVRECTRHVYESAEDQLFRGCLITLSDYGHIGTISRGSYPSLESAPTEAGTTSLRA
jgi:hypothetical protein